LSTRSGARRCSGSVFLAACQHSRPHLAQVQHRSSARSLALALPTATADTVPWHCCLGVPVVGVAATCSVLPAIAPRRHHPRTAAVAPCESMLIAAAAAHVCSHPDHSCPGQQPARGPHSGQPPYAGTDAEPTAADHPASSLPYHDTREMLTHAALLLQEGNTALHLAAREGHIAAVQLLLRSGANPAACNRVGAPPGQWSVHDLVGGGALGWLLPLTWAHQESRLVSVALWVLPHCGG
jgi:hypothetical protein